MNIGQNGAFNDNGTLRPAVVFAVNGDGTVNVGSGRDAGGGKFEWRISTSVAVDSAYPPATGKFVAV